MTQIPKRFLLILMFFLCFEGIPRAVATESQSHKAPVPLNLKPAISKTESKPSQASLAPCEIKTKSPAKYPFSTGETLIYDIDIMGARAATLTLSVDTQAAGSHAFTASTKTNNFFSNIRSVEGKATSFPQGSDLYPLRYREDSTEDGIRKWSEVLFPTARKEVDVRFGIGQRERRVRYPVTDSTMDIISLVYYLRTIEFSIGNTFCFDVYANRRVWRVTGEIAGEELVRTPAGAFETWRLSGKAQRMDLPTFEREIHLWIAQNDQRTPVAAMSAIDLGPVRAKLSRYGDSKEPSRKSSPVAGRW